MNISTVQLRHPQLPAMIGELLQAHQLPAETLELEVTETGLMEDIDAAAHNLHSLRRSGALIAIDDFGTGYSSLSYLKRFPVHYVKIDQTFIRDLSPGGEDAAITRAIIAMAHSLELKVVAEGVETQAQMDFLKANLCDEIQGYLLSPPVPAEQFAELLR